LLDGVTAPVDNGFSNQERMKCTSSRLWIFFSRRAVEGKGIMNYEYYMTEIGTLTGIAPDGRGQV
jgi:hypothetical protein